MSKSLRKDKEVTLQTRQEETPAVLLRQLKTWLSKEIQEELPRLRQTADPKQGYQEYLGQLQVLNTREQVLREVWDKLHPSGSELFEGKFNPEDFLGAEDSSDPRAVMSEWELADL